VALERWLYFGGLPHPLLFEMHLAILARLHRDGGFPETVIFAKWLALFANPPHRPEQLPRTEPAPEPGSKEAIMPLVGVFAADDDLDEQFADIKTRRQRRAKG
jgi:hypothetical protein